MSAALGARVVFGPRAAEAQQGANRDAGPPRAAAPRPRGATWSTGPRRHGSVGTVVRHRGGLRGRSWIPTVARGERAPRNMRMGDEEEDRAAAALLPDSRGSVERRRHSQPRQPAAAVDSESAITARYSSACTWARAGAGSVGGREMLRGGLSRDRIEALLQASGVSSGPGGSITRRPPGADNDVGVFSVVSSRSPIPPGVGGGLAGRGRARHLRGWSRRHANHAQRHLARPASKRRRGGHRARAVGLRPPGVPRTAACAFRRREAGRTSASPRRRHRPLRRRRREVREAPVVRVRFALAARMIRVPSPPPSSRPSRRVPNGSATRVPTLSRVPGIYRRVYAARARAAAGSPPTTLRAAPGARPFHPPIARGCGCDRRESTGAGRITPRTSSARWITTGGSRVPCFTTTSASRVSPRGWRRRLRNFRGGPNRAAPSRAAPAAAAEQGGPDCGP